MKFLASTISNAEFRAIAARSSGLCLATAESSHADSALAAGHAPRRPSMT
jgi:hypothetical protein